MTSAYHTSTHIKCPDAKLSTMLRVFFMRFLTREERALNNTAPWCPSVQFLCGSPLQIIGTQSRSWAQMDLVNECTASTHPCKIGSKWGVNIPGTTTIRLFDSNNYSTKTFTPHLRSYFTPFNAKNYSPQGHNTITDCHSRYPREKLKLVVSAEKHKSLQLQTTDISTIPSRNIKLNV